MAILLIAEFDIRDRDVYQAYRDAARPRVAQYGGKVVGRAYDDDVIVVEGDQNPNHVIVIEFPDLASAQAWHDGPEMAAANAARRKSSASRFTIVPAV